MKRNATRAFARHRMNARPAFSGDWPLVLIDQAPLRRQAVSECHRELTRLEKAKAEWKRFESEDKKAYGKWMAATFGPILSRIREVDALIREKETLIREVDREMFRSGSRSGRAAYARVLERRNNPTPEPEAPRQAPPPKPSTGSYDSENPFDGDANDPMNLKGMAERLMFESYCVLELGLDPSRLRPSVYERLFADFRANVLRAERPRPKPRAEPPPEALPAPAPPPTQNRVKELYRLLVRKLHPDTFADRDAEVSALWHEVQIAYAAGDVERLEMLLALADVQSNTVSEQTSLSQMRSVLAELRRSYRALQKSLREAKKHPAWRFSRLTDCSALEAQIREDLIIVLADAEEALESDEELIASWSRPRTRKTPGSAGSSARTRRRTTAQTS
jgi:hypothetical protein